MLSGHLSNLAGNSCKVSENVHNVMSKNCLIRPNNIFVRNFVLVFLNFLS